MTSKYPRSNLLIRLRTLSLSALLLAGSSLALFPSEVYAQKDLPKATKADSATTPKMTDAKSSEWEPLFDGKSLDSWVQKNGWASFRIDGETILGRTAVGSPNSFLCTKKNYLNFELRFEVQVDDGLNSGVQFRSKSIPEKDKGRVHGPQVEIMAGPGQAGYIYGEATGRGWLSPDTKTHDHFKNGEWNQYHIRAEGNRMTTWLNGHLVEDLIDPPSASEGFIGLQVHGIGKDKGPFQVRWRNIAIRPIK